MHAISITKAILVGLLASIPVASAFGVNDVVEFERRHVGSLATYASKMVRAAAPEVVIAKRQAPDEFGPWDSDEDEFGSWVNKRDPHHTESQIAAKVAAAQAASGNTAPTTPASTQGGRCNNNKKRHHTESQIAAKAASQGADAGNTGAGGNGGQGGQGGFGNGDGCDN